MTIRRVTTVYGVQLSKIEWLRHIIKHQPVKLPGEIYDPDSSLRKLVVYCSVDEIDKIVKMFENDPQGMVIDKGPDRVCGIGNPTLFKHVGSRLNISPIPPKFLKYPTLEDLDLYEQGDQSEKGEEVYEAIEEFLMSYVYQEEIHGLWTFTAKGGRHEHDESQVVVGIDLFDARVEGPGSKTSFSLSKFSEYQSKIAKCNQFLRQFFDKDLTPECDMYTICNDCQCCS